MARASPSIVAMLSTKMLISTPWATRKTSARLLGIASPATSSGIPVATSEPKTSSRTTATTGSETSSAFWRSFSDCVAESWVIGP